MRTYNPTLLDELRVSVGEYVAVVNEFDDGWGYCEKIGDADGAAGVVPLECLDRSKGSISLEDLQGLMSPPAYTASTSGASSSTAGVGEASTSTVLQSGGPPMMTKSGVPAAPASVGHTSVASQSLASSSAPAAAGTSGTDAQGQAQTTELDSHRISARFSSFHVDFDAIHSNLS